jgi:hypothetical protein
VSGTPPCCRHMHVGFITLLTAPGVMSPSKPAWQGLALGHLVNMLASPPLCFPLKPQPSTEPGD